MDGFYAKTRAKKGGSGERTIFHFHLRRQQDLDSCQKERGGDNPSLRSVSGGRPGIRWRSSAYLSSYWRLIRAPMVNDGNGDNGDTVGAREQKDEARQVLTLFLFLVEAKRRHFSCDVSSGSGPQAQVAASVFAFQLLKRHPLTRNPARQSKRAPDFMQALRNEKRCSAGLPK